ncbi:MAG: SUMF1/EgtB/PvdO family nonheme iron enzyme [Myxococcales bacterium]|nr:SUMF1/EgtB/PvdO family nonheme iron enzyme [Myxococcales bacterium]MCB9576408.1 SUMF1/EgtB/PvdO family nonheme iron enzyme [Polyangiaceae bacterium]
MGEGKDPKRAYSPAEVAHTLRVRDAPTIDVRDSVPTVSGIRERSDDAESTPSTPKRRYRRVGVLGEGGMGQVDEVFDCVLGRSVAKKALLLDADDHRAALLIAEAQICAQLEHPAIVPLYDLDADGDGRPYYTMRVVHGRTLRDALEASDARLPLAQTLAIFRQVCLAVDYAHNRGVVHRDLKPENVVLGEFGEVYVVDWGIATVLEGSSVSRSAEAPRVAGTPCYMAPEQALGNDVDGRADVFSLGVMLYEILAGSRPFPGKDVRSVFARRRQNVEVPPSRRGAGAPTAFDALVLACLSPEARYRPGRARVIAAAVDEFLDGERARQESEREAASCTERALSALADFEALDREARQERQAADEELAELPPWKGAEEKAGAWSRAARARSLSSNAARALARAETELTRALSHVGDYAPARQALADLYFRQFRVAEVDGDEEQMAQLLDLARSYDDGALVLELANRGELCVRASGRVRVARYEPRGPLLATEAPIDVGPEPTLLEAGSYVVVAETGVRYPLLVKRAVRHELVLADAPAIPDGFVVIPGGPFLAADRAGRLAEQELPGFAIGRFPVTIAEYVQFLDSIEDQAERARRTPSERGEPEVLRGLEGWRLAEHVLEGAGGRRVPPEHHLDLPVTGIRWFDAVAYARWKSRVTGFELRLPRDLEWEKAMRGADGRPYPMAVSFDPAFAKTRDSREEPAQREPVGAFALDESPFGVRDLGGGVGDWTESTADGSPTPDPDADGTEDTQMIWRGGTWSSARPGPGMRYSQAIRWRVAYIGFRLALSLPDEKSELVRTPMTRQC